MNLEVSEPIQKFGETMKLINNYGKDAPEWDRAERWKISQKIFDNICEFRLPHLIGKYDNFHSFLEYHWGTTHKEVHEKVILKGELC